MDSKANALSLKKTVSFDKPKARDVVNSIVNIKQLMPDYDSIPDEFKDLFSESNKYIAFQAKWFFDGLSEEDVAKLVAKDDIDKMEALVHLSAIQRSYDCTHEHKVAAVAYLASLYFEEPDIF